MSKIIVLRHMQYQKNLALYMYMYIYHLIHITLHDLYMHVCLDL